MGPLGPEGETDRLGDPGRRPLGHTERPAALALGVLLVELRRERGLAQLDVAARSGMAARSLRRLERGERRTRASTLLRLAEAIDPSDPHLLPRLIEAAGPALAPESQYRERVEARRQRRRRAASRRFVTETTVTRTDTASGTLEVTIHRRRIGRHRVVETTRRRVAAAVQSAPGKMGP